MAVTVPTNAPISGVGAAAAPGLLPPGISMPGDMMMEMGKPKCGGGGVQGEYDLLLHTIGLFLVLFASIAGAGFPVVAKKFKNLRIPPKVFFFCKHFGTGVLIATAFVHLLPTAFQSLGDPCLPNLFTDQYPPIPGAIMMLSLFSIFGIELWLNHKMGGHSHGGATGEGLTGHGEIHVHNPAPRREAPPRPPRSPIYDEDGWIDEKKTYAVKNKEMFGFKFFDDSNTPPRSEMPLWFIAFYEQYIRQRDEMVSMIQYSMPHLPRYQAEEKATVEVSKFDNDIESGEVDPLVLRKLSLGITMLEGGILFHSIFVGVTVAITVDGFIVLLIAILFHQFFEGLGLGSRIAAVPYPKGNVRPWLLVFAFGTTAPIGMAIGLATRSAYDPQSAFALILVGVANAISSGLLVYAALIDLLQEDFLSEESSRRMTIRQKLVALIYVLMGAAGMSIVGAFA